MSESTQTPSVGRIVLYYPPKAARDPARPRAAIITRVWQDTEHSLVNLHVFGNDLDDCEEIRWTPTPTSVPHGDSEVPLAFTWAWPPRVA